MKDVFSRSSSSNNGPRKDYTIALKSRDDMVHLTEFFERNDFKGQVGDYHMMAVLPNVSINCTEIVATKLRTLPCVRYVQENAVRSRPLTP